MDISFSVIQTSKAFRKCTILFFRFFLLCMTKIWFSTKFTAILATFFSKLFHLNIEKLENAKNMLINNQCAAEETMRRQNEKERNCKRGGDSIYYRECWISKHGLCTRVAWGDEMIAYSTGRTIIPAITAFEIKKSKEDDIKNHTNIDDPMNIIWVLFSVLYQNPNRYKQADKSTKITHLEMRTHAKSHRNRTTG